jgi:hypothetical protein
LAYSIAPFGAGITQLVECQLPKLKVAGSNPVARSILLFLVLSISVPCMAQTDSTLWRLRAGLDAGRAVTGTLLVRYELNLLDYGNSPEAICPPGSPWATPTTAVGILAAGSDVELRLRERITGGDRSCMIPLVCFLVSRGLPDRASAVFESSAAGLPATRRDLGIALSWFGRHALYDILTALPDAPPDLVDDDYGQTLAAVVLAGWMSLAPDGLFHPWDLVTRHDLEVVSATMPGTGTIPEGRWFSVAQIDAFLAPGASDVDR